MKFVVITLIVFVFALAAYLRGRNRVPPAIILPPEEVEDTDVEIPNEPGKDF